MDTFRIANLQETDFDAIIRAAGGTRIDLPDNRLAGRTADYRIGNTLVELKLVREEGLEKEERQKKLASLFDVNQPNRPVVVLAPDILSEAERRDYYRIMETPIKSHIAKATKQLKDSARRFPDVESTAILLVNTGYNSLGMHEFEEVAQRRATSDTLHLDYLITAGIYFYGDGFDYYTIESLRLLPLDLRKTFPEFTAIEGAWHDYTDQMMTSVVTGRGSEAYDKGVVVDVSFTLDSVTYVKPSPKIGGDSKFHKYGRPRANSTSTRECPPLGLIFPHLTISDWTKASNELSDPTGLEGSYYEYVQKETKESQKPSAISRPFICYPTNVSEYLLAARGQGILTDYAGLCNYVTGCFSAEVRSVCESAINIETSRIVPSRYVFLEINEIGQDKAFDLCSAYIVHELGSSASKEVLFEFLRMFFEYGVALASAYAIKKSVSVVVYKRDTRFRWD